MENNRPSGNGDPLDEFFDGFREELQAARQGGDSTPNAPADTEEAALRDFFDGFHEDILRARLGQDPVGDRSATRGLSNEINRRRQQ